MSLTRGRRAAVELGLLPLLYVLSLPNPAAFGQAIAYVLLASPAITGTVAAILIWTSRQAPEFETLRERADDAVTSFFQAVGGAAVGAVAILATFGITIPGRPTLALLAWVMLLIAVPAIGWLTTWRSTWLPMLRRRQAEVAIASTEGVSSPDTSAGGGPDA